MNQANKIESKLLSKQHKKFAAKYKIVKSKLLQIKESKETIKKLIQDLTECNNSEIMCYLVLTEVTFNCKDAYLKHVNNWIDQEKATYYYNLPDYNGRNFETISKMVKLRHEFLDLRKKIFGDE